MSTLRRVPSDPVEGEYADQPSATNGPPFIQLAELDNVVVLTRHVEAGEALEGLDGETWTMTANLEAGNKLAAHPIAVGEPVLKYGFPIGTATEHIEPGSHVHLHNLRSDHIPIEIEVGDGERSR
jgi:hypothetical protein